MKDDFYIGWQAEAPDEQAQKIRRTVYILAVLVTIISAAFVLSQRGFESSVFEFGNSKTITGTLVKQPVPMLKTKAENGAVQSVILVGFGKFGAEQDLLGIEKNIGEEIENRTINLAGTRIYHDGKMLLELTDGVDSFQGIEASENEWVSEKEEIGEVTLKGEILDPKCALGVMKPGEGKPHRSCAVRCISGGIPPVFRMTNSNGETNYCLVKGRGGEAINQLLLPYIADQVRICGRLERDDDWLILYTDPANEILRLQPYWMDGETTMCNPIGD